MINKLECVNRDEFYQKLSTKILESGSFSFQFVGKNGTGKEYVLNYLQNYEGYNLEVHTWGKT